MDLYREIGDEAGVAFALYQLSLEMLSQGDLASARRMSEESVELYRREDGTYNVHDRATSLSILGVVASAQQDYVAARAAVEESIMVSRNARDDYTLAGSLASLGIIVYREGEYDRAAALIQEFLGVYRASSGDTLTICLGVKILAMVEAERGEPDRATHLFGAEEGLREMIGAAETTVFERGEYDRSLSAAREGLSETGFAAAWAEGKTMTLEEALAYALDEDPR